MDKISSSAVNIAVPFESLVESISHFSLHEKLKILRVIDDHVIVPEPFRAQLDLRPVEIRGAVISKNFGLKDNLRPDWCIKLRGYKNEYRIGIGSYRVRYEIHNDISTVFLLHCKHRRDVYG